MRIISESLRQRFSDLIDLADITNPDPVERQRSLLTRALAAAIVADRTRCDDAHAASMVTDGGRDFGIDAVAFASGSPRLWLIQTKWSSRAEARFGEADVLTLADGLHKIDHQEFDRFNARFDPLLDRIAAMLSDAQARVTLTIGVMRKEPLHDNVVLRLRELRERFNVHGEYLDFEVLYVDDIWDLLRRPAQPQPIQLSFQLGRWLELSTPMRAVSGTTTASEVAQWYDKNGDRIFSRNIRESLGLTQVNAEIQRSLLEEPYEFWYRNNGVTILCNSLRLTPMNRSAPHGPVCVVAEDVSIVNGAQTVAAIANVVGQGADSAGQALVGVRVIESSDHRSSSQITKATNTQNHIERRDFAALDDVQLAIREEFHLTLGLTYAIRRSEFEPSPESGCTVREAAIALACAHSDPRMAQRARNNEDLLWEEGPAGAYSRIFGQRPTAIQVWRSVRLLRKVRDSLHTIQAEVQGRAATIAEQGSLIIAHILFQTIGRDGIDDSDYDWDAVLVLTSELVRQTVRRLAVEIDAQFGASSFVGPTLASAERIRPLVRSVLYAIESGNPAPTLPSEYLLQPKKRGPRRPNTVHLLVDAGRIKDGSHLAFRAATEPERQALATWLDEDPRRASATWVNDRTRPLVWAADGKRYTPSGLVMRMYALAEWSGAPVAVQGTTRWHLADEGSLVVLAETSIGVIQESEGARP